MTEKESLLSLIAEFSESLVYWIRKPTETKQEEFIKLIRIEGLTSVLEANLHEYNNNIQ